MAQAANFTAESAKILRATRRRKAEFFWLPFEASNLEPAIFIPSYSAIHSLAVRFQNRILCVFSCLFVAKFRVCCVHSSPAFSAFLWPLCALCGKLFTSRPPWIVE